MADTSSSAADAPLQRYRQKRDFKRTPEPTAEPSNEPRGQTGTRRFVIQKHWARSLHYDFRLELDGVLLSWAVPKGPSYDPADKRMAIHVEDHPISYGSFEGKIPARQYGAGSVIVWDHGTWEPVVEPVVEPREAMKAGKLVFRLHGEKLAGLWELVRIAKPDARQDQWLLFKKRDEWARPRAEYDVIASLPDSVLAQPLGPVEVREPRGAGPRAALPRTLEPQLATLVDSPPPGTAWTVEAKFDGYRILARIDDGKAKLVTRGGHDWTARMKPLAAAVQGLGIDSAWLDGEIVVLDSEGRPDFSALQNALDNSRGKDIVYFLFDAPYLGGEDLCNVPLWSRRARLRQLLDRQSTPAVRFSEDFDAPPEQMLEAAREMKLEGIILKRRDAPYASGRSDTWLKLKCSLRQEFVVCGFADRAGAAKEVGALHLGYHENGKLRSAGSVGTGWDSRTARMLRTRLARLVTDEPALQPGSLPSGRWSKRGAAAVHWVKPELVAEIAFAAWTPDGYLRHASFQGLRFDKPASQVVRESPTSSRDGPSGGRPAAAGAGAGFRISNPDRVIDPSTGLKKIDLVRYYESIADWIMPHLKDRPVSLLRAPDGISGEQFFQKHPETRMPGLTTLAASLWPGHAPLLAIADAGALVQAAQMNMVELHTWNAVTTRIDKPDRMVFDLDPGEGVAWAQVQEAALLTRTLLTELGLDSWLKTSGGKGLHLLVPLAPRLDSAVVKDFSRAVVQHLVRTIPARFAAKSGPSNRIGKVFVDYLRNGHAQTTAAAFSARARPGMGVSMPIDWDQLTTLKSGAQWTVSTAREYLSLRRDDPWAGFWKSRQGLAGAMKALGYKPRKESPPAPRKKPPDGDAKRRAGVD